MGLALLNHESARGFLPPGQLAEFGWNPPGTPNGLKGNYFSVQTQLLPYHEAENVQDLFNLNEDIYDRVVPGNIAAAEKAPEVRLCASEHQRGQPGDMGWTNYHANAGSWARLAGWDGAFGAVADISADGQTIPALPALVLKKVSDGASNTAAFAEMVNGLRPESEDSVVAPGAGNPLADCFDSGGMPFPAGGGNQTLQQIRDRFLNRPWVTAALPAALTGSWRFRGNPWVEGTMWMTWYNHLLPPNSTCWKAGEWWFLISPPSSYHSDTVNVVMLDGSVQVISSTIDPNVWTDMGTREGLPKN
jgi:prepilin-type processing-associated H-X9-DG protein